MGGGPVSLDANVRVQPPRRNFEWHDVRFIGALAGCYAMSDRRSETEDKIPVYACRLCSISTRLAVIMGPVVGEEGEVVTAHFEDFGILRGRIRRKLLSGFVMDLMLTPDNRDRLGGKIAWTKRRVLSHVPDQREHKRILPREPRTVVTLADATRIPCFVIDVSQSGIAVSADLFPEIGTPMAVGRLVGRVVRNLDLGFALQFQKLHPIEDLENLMLPPAAGARLVAAKAS